MKISVIIPVYNCVTFLKACIESVINQTYTNLEIILVDDGSSDGSEKLCDSYAEIDNRIKVIHQNNSGVSSARNAGMRKISGDLVSFIDADDTLDLDMYEFLHDLLRKYNADIAHCGYRHIVGEEIRLVHDNKQVYLQDNKKAIECLVGGKLFVGSLWNKLYRKEVLDELYFDETIKINEDILFNFMAFKKAGLIVFADYAKYNYIAHKESSACFVTPDEKKAADACAVNKYIYENSVDCQYENVAVERYIRSLSSYYRICSSNGASSNVLKEIRKTIRQLSKGSRKLSRNMLITACMICNFPVLYNCIYNIYDRIRKPNWEV